MAADTFEALSYKHPAVYSRNTVGEIVRNVKVDLDLLVGAAGSSGCNPLEANDVIKLFKLPPDVKITFGRLDSEALDSSTSLTVDLIVTDGTTTKYLFNASTIARAGGFVSTEDAAASGVIDAFDSNPAIGYVIPDDDFYVALKCSAAPAGAGAGDQFMATVKYVSALEAGEPAFRT